MHLPLTRLIPLIAWLLTMFIAPTALAQEQVEIEGATFPTRIEQQGQSYRLIGSGMFRYLMWDAYAGAYYQASDEPEPAPQSDVPRRLELEYFHAITAEDFAKATEDTLRDGMSDDAYQQIRQRVEAFSRQYRDVDPGDRYMLSWDGKTLSLALNGERVFAANDLTLANALFGIWLGDKPLGDDFRDALLGR
ncbi:Chalcone isomerase-like [Onishia taeanensis]|uniref:Chalcone isomerase-like n=1 Tax=Onishia taeanensis TaxID=284577 RepID=A0A1G7T975_9GAMM|nr:chalcone isomerase family protein [Halomonas taeanensis]SDG31825.1 Chalcone isomerase-like [Halomonas taeanensis]